MPRPTTLAATGLALVVPALLLAAPERDDRSLLQLCVESAAGAPRGKAWPLRVPGRKVEQVSLEPPVLDARVVASAEVSWSPDGAPQLRLVLTTEGRESLVARRSRFEREGPSACELLVSSGVEQLFPGARRDDGSSRGASSCTFVDGLGQTVRLVVAGEAGRKAFESEVASAGKRSGTLRPEPDLGPSGVSVLKGGDAVFLTLDGETLVGLWARTARPPTRLSSRRSGASRRTTSCGRRRPRRRRSGRSSSLLRSRSSSAPA